MTNKPLIIVISGSLISLVALVGVLLTGLLRPPVAPAPDKNGPAVVRVSVVDGSVVVQRGESRVQTNAVLNAPLIPGDYISTGSTSRSELQFDGYTAVRLGGNVQARVIDDNANDRKVQLAGGTIEIGVLHAGRAMEIDTPSATVRTHQPGDLRISIAADGATWITARRGSGDVVTPQQTYELGTGRTLVARGSASDPAIAYTAEVAFDSFDEFNVERDNTMVAALNASPNLNPIIAGYDDLGAYGQWQAVAGYGQSWVPNEPAGWAPYRNGSWTWEGGYGWTWIGSEPWGWAPYHYGNWYYCGCGSSGWAWLPPAHAAKLAWSPALVGFFEFDTGAVADNPCEGNYGYAPGSYASTAAPPSNAAPVAPYNSGAPAPYGVGGPNPGLPAGPGYGYPAGPQGYGSGSPASYGYPYPYIGWVPIAPYESFYPWYPGWGWTGFGWGYPTRIVHITNVTNITRIYRNFRYGATATTMRNFRHGTVHGRTVAVSTHDLGRRFGTIHGALPVSPTRDNLAFSHGAVRAPVSFSKAFKSPRFASDRALAARTSFARQQKAVAEAIRGGPSRHAAAHAVASRANAPGSRTSVPATHMSSTIAHANVQEMHANAPGTHAYAPGTHAYAPVTRENAAMTRENAAPVRANAAPATRQNSATMHENSEPREGSAASSRIEASRNDLAPSAPSDRSSAGRGEARPAEFPAGSAGANSAADRHEDQVSAPSDAGREEAAPSDSWGRFSASRNESYESTRNPYADRESSEAGREDSAPSDSWGRFSASRGESYEGARNPYADRGSYPSYSRGSYPSYSRGSYPSYSRGSYPSYSRGNSAPRSSGGGGGGEHHGGGGRPH